MQCRDAFFEERFFGQDGEFGVVGGGISFLVLPNGGDGKDFYFNIPIKGRIHFVNRYKYLLATKSCEEMVSRS